MANITLPSNPVNGQTVTIGTRLFEYNSTTQRWSSRVFQPLGDTSVTVTNQAPTITASLSEVALDTTGANVLFTYTVSDVDSSALRVSHEVNGITNSTYATVYHHKANNTVTIQAGTANFSSANVVLTVTDGRNNASVSIDVSAVYPWVVEVDDITYDSVQGFVSSVEGNGDPSEINFNPDGTILHCLDGDDFLYQYTLSTAWDLSTITYDTKWDSGLNFPEGMAWKSDGTIVYLSDIDQDRIYQYPVSTAWDIATVGSSTGNFNVLSGTSDGSTSDQPKDLAFNDDGTKMYVVAGDDYVYQYTLSTAWDVTSASYDSVRLATGSNEDSPMAITFSETGTRLYIVGSGTDGIDQYDLTTAWDLSTATYSKTSINLADSFPQGMFFKSDGTKWYLSGTQYNRLYQYSTGL